MTRADSGGSEQQFRHYRPARPLADFVELFWYWRGHSTPHSRERLLPTGTVELVIDLNSEHPEDSVVAGARTSAWEIDRTAADHLLGIHFQPGGAWPFLPFAFRELRDTDLSIADLWGETRARELLERLQAATSVTLRFRVLEQWLVASARRPLGHHRAVAYALGALSAEPPPVALLAERVGLSQRRFIQLFEAEVGFTPKLYSRLQRFTRTVDRVARVETEVDWPDLALELGYYDQAHFNHEFSEFSGLTPRQYLTRRTAHSHHVQA